ncbi:hypothetical protein JR316_0003806 [Psilocybe cubensis]|uniref:Uncharacterized protein n=2 Tax=Psilocybe cubensis TaxID=181762 RepID=A0ACB8HAZ6_PSICU|nr:hypothetical protein JR316_0003806 [Psilocybe cubensis]KAH9484325.1 hypothetical protein JR316_0003806 [Psilocybe cubensis]
MALNDQNILQQSGMGANTYPGIANPTPSSGAVDPTASNFVNDPTTATRGAGAGLNFEGHKNAKQNLRDAAGVVEARPGIIETTNIDPLNENSNKDDGWANATTKTANTSHKDEEPGVVTKIVNTVLGK